MAYRKGLIKPSNGGFFKITPMSKDARKALNEMQEFIDTYRLHDREDTITGVEGIIAADEILTEIGGVGFLVGDISEKIWNSRVKREELDEYGIHVLVAKGGQKSTEHEALDRIAWLIPKTFYGTKRDIIYHCNARDLLPYQFVMESGRGVDLEPGLHLLGRDNIADLLIAAAKTNTGYDDKISDINKAEEVLRKRIKNNILKTSLPRYISNMFYKKDDDKSSLDYGMVVTNKIRDQKFFRGISPRLEFKPFSQSVYTDILAHYEKR